MLKTGVGGEEGVREGRKGRSGDCWGLMEDDGVAEGTGLPGKGLSGIMGRKKGEIWKGKGRS